MSYRKTFTLSILFLLLLTTAQAVTAASFNETAYWDLPSMADQTGNGHALSNHGAPTVESHPPRAGAPDATEFYNGVYVSSDDSLDDIIDLSEDWTMNMWSYGSETLGTSGSLFLAADGSEDDYMSARVSDNGKQLDVTLYEYLGNELLWHFNVPGEVFSSIAPVHNDVLNEDGEYSYVGVSSSAASLLMVNSTGHQIWTLTGFEGGVNAIATAKTSAGTVYVGDDQRVYKVHPDGTTIYWTGSAKGRVNALETYNSPGGVYLLAGRDNGNVYKYDSNANFYWKTDALPAPVTAVTTEGNGDYVYAACEDGNVYQYDYDTGELRQTFTGATDDTTGVVVDNTKVYSSSQDGLVRAHNLNTGALEWYYDTGSPVNTITTDGNWLYPGKENGEIEKLSTQGTHIWTDPNRFSSVIDDMTFSDKIYAATHSYAYAIEENQTSAQLTGTGLIGGYWNMWSLVRQGDNISLYANTLLRDSTTQDFTLELNGSYELGRGITSFKGYQDEIRLYDTWMGGTALESLYWFSNPNVDTTEHLKVSTADALTGEDLYGPTVTVDGSTYESGGLPYVIVPDVIKDLETSVDVKVSASGYGTRTYESYNPSTQGDLDAELYPGNALHLEAYDITDGSEVSDFTVTVYGESENTTIVINSETTTDGEVWVPALTEGLHHVHITPQDSSYKGADFEFEINTGQVTHREVYLNSGPGLYDAEVSVWFKGGGGPEPDILVEQYGEYNGIWRLVSQDRTSQGVVVSGADFNVSPDGNYMFVAKEPGYDYEKRVFPSSEIDGDLTFTLTLSRKPVSPVDLDVSIGVRDHKFEVNTTSWAAVDFVSEERNLISYNASLKVGNCTYSQTVEEGSTAVGSRLNTSCPHYYMDNATRGEIAIVKVCYDSRDGQGCLTRQYPVKEEGGRGPGLKEESENWGSLEKAILATLFILIVAGGLGAASKSPVLSGVGLIISAGICTYALGWINPWMFYVIALPSGMIVATAFSGGEN